MGARIAQGTRAKVRATTVAVVTVVIALVAPAVASAQEPPTASPGATTLADPTAFEPGITTGTEDPRPTVHPSTTAAAPIADDPTIEEGGPPAGVETDVASVPSGEPNGPTGTAEPAPDRSSAQAVTPMPDDLWDVQPDVAPGRSYVVLQGPNEDPVSEGVDGFYTQADAEITVRVTGGGHINVGVSGERQWHGTFTGSSWAVVAEEGFHQIATGPGAYPWSDWHGGRASCRPDVGWFAVDELTRDGADVRLLTLRFEHSCWGAPPLRGKIHFVADDPTRPAPPQPIPADLWDADPGLGPGRSYVVVDGVEGDPVSGGADHLYTKANAQLLANVRRGFLEVAANGDERWYGTFAPTYALDELVPGFYPGAYNGNNKARPRVDWRLGGLSCIPAESWMVIDEITTAGDDLLSVTARLAQSCQGQPPLHVKVHWVASDPTQPPGPAPVPEGLWDIDPPGAGPNYVVLTGWPTSARPDGVQVYTPHTSDLRVALVGNRIHVDVRHGGSGWEGDFTAMSSLDQIEVGFYQGSRWGSRLNPARGGVSWGPNPAKPPWCSMADTWFALDHLVLAGNRISELTVRFELDCEDQPTMRGKVQVRSDPGLSHPPGPPFGALDVVQPRIGAVEVAGWAIDPDTPAPTDVHVYVDDHGYATRASGWRPDVAAAFAGYGSNHGYRIRVPAAPGPRTVCAYGINVGVGHHTLLGCRQVLVPTSAPFGTLDVARLGPPGTVDVAGWAIDGDTTEPIDVHVYVGARGTALRADQARPDVAASFVDFGPRHGFSARVAASPGTHQVCAYGINVAAGHTTLLGCQTVTVSSGPPFGVLDTVQPGGERVVDVAGWAIDPDTGEAIDVHVYIDGVGVAALTAGGSRPDVGAAHRQFGQHHGFSGRVPAPSGMRHVCVYAIDVVGTTNPLLGCRFLLVPGL